MTKASTAKSLPPSDTQTWMHAVEEGDMELVKSRLAAGADVNAVSDGGKTALIRAATRGYTDIVRVLLDAGADVHAQKENGATALMLAVFFGHADIVRALLAKGADPTAQTPQGTPIVEWAQFIGFTEIVELLMNAQAIRAGSSTQGLNTNREQLVGAELFSTDGPFHPVVPLSEIDRTAPLVEIASTEIATLAGASERDVEDGERRTPERVEHEEVTIVPPRIRTQSRLQAPFAGRGARTLLPWPVTILFLVLLLIAGLVLDPEWKRLRRSAEVGQSAPLLKEASPATDDKTPTAQPQAATQVSDATESRDVSSAAATSSSAPNERNPKALKDAEAKPVAASVMPIISEDRRAAEAAPPVRRGATAEAAATVPSITASREKEVTAATENLRRETRPESRASSTDSRVQTSTSPARSLPVSTPPPVKSEQKRVIQWP